MTNRSRALRAWWVTAVIGWAVAVSILFGPGRWRKLKGIATVRLRGGDVRLAELHWYEAHGIGRRELKIKRLLD